MNTVCKRAVRAVILLPLFMVGFFVTAVHAHATVLDSFNFDTAGDLDANFTAGTGDAFNEADSVGLSGTRAINVTNLSNIYTEKNAHAAVGIGSSYTTSAYFYNDGNSGYGGLGVITASQGSQSNGSPQALSGVGMFFHGGGGGFVNDSTDVQDVNWDGGNMGTGWYKMIFSYTRTGSNTYDLVFQIWNADSDGNLGALKTQRVFSVVNDAISADGVSLYPYFLASGSRFDQMDNFTVSDDGLIPPFAGTGTGTSGDPYIITSCTQLQSMEDHPSAHYKLGQDIDCSESASWNADSSEWDGGVVGGTLIPDSYASQTHTDIIVANNGYFGFNPVGNDNAPFTGELDGNNHTISNLWIFREANNDNGIFGATENASVHDLTIDHANVVGGASTGGVIGHMMGGTLDHVTSTNSMVRAYLNTYGGGLVGYMENSAVFSNNTVTGGNVHGSGNVIGGLIGYMSSGTVTGSSSSADVDGGMYIGGAIGEMDGGSADNVHATGNVLSNHSEYIIMKTGFYTGGFVGGAFNASITNSYATGTVNSSGYYTGGFAGLLVSSGMDSVYETGDVTGMTETIDGTTYEQDRVGGLVGGAYGVEISNSSAVGNVVTDGSYVGGFFGDSSSADVAQSSATGNVTAGGISAGGFIGYADGDYVNDSYASGDVSGASDVGGFAGDMSNGSYTNTYSRGHVDSPGAYGGFAGVPSGELTIMNSFYDQDTSGASDTSPNIVPEPSSLMKTEGTFTDVGWSFGDVWAIDSGKNNGYPYLAWQTPAITTPPPVLTEVTPIASQTLVGNALYSFTTDSACSLEVSPIDASPAGGDVSVRASNAPQPGQTTIFSFTGLQVGATYSLHFACRDDNGGESNTLNIGPFTVIPPATGGVSGGSSSITWNPITNVTTNTASSVTPVNSPATCPASQMLTQNLRSGARDGKYNSYTKAVAKEVAILQGHMNRLGFSAGSPDGIWGKTTDGAIKRMQKYLGTTQDGIVGPLTRGLINQSCGQGGLQKK